MINNTLDKSLNFALEASAGTGKTYRLSMRVVGMILTGAPLRDILCLTFTNKATDEMSERIISVLAALSAGMADKNQKDDILALMKSYKKNKNDYSEIDLQNDAKQGMDKLLEEFSSLKIKTIDSFFNNILQIFPFEARLRPDYTTCSDDENNAIQKKAFYRILTTLLENEKWQQVILQLIDVMEENKTSIIDNMLKYTLFSVSKRIELQLPVKKASLLSAESILEALEEATIIKEKIIEKCHIFANILNQKTLDKNQEKAQNKLEKIESFNDAVGNKFLQAVEPTSHGHFKRMTFAAHELDLHNEIRKNISKYLLLKGNILKALSLLLGGALYIEQKNIKSEKNILTYTDISERVFDILVTDKTVDKDYLYFRLDAKINHILIDEFQDTSTPQWLILKPLAEEAMSGIGQYDKSGSFFYVGDPKQNLYRFRGGSSALFEQIAHTYRDKLLHETLDTNYRSSKNIVDTVNIIFNNAVKKFQIKELNIFKIQQKTLPEKEDGYVFIDYPQIENEEYEDFTSFCARKVDDALKAGFSLQDIAILVPDNKDGLEVKSILIEKDIPVRLETSSKLDQTSVFKAMIGLAQFIETKENFPFSQFALTGTPAFDITKYVDKEKRMAIKENILKIADQCGKQTIFEKILVIIKDSNIQKRFEKEPDFIQTIDVMATNAGDETNISDFIKTVQKAASEKTSLTAGDYKAVSVMTVHKSKGLQFPCVILPKLNFKLKTNAKDSSFILTETDKGATSMEFVHNADCAPFLSNIQQAALNGENAMVVQDSLNKLYVAMTRAENALMVMVEKPKKDLTSEASNMGQAISEFINLPYETGTLSPINKAAEHATKEYTTGNYCKILEDKIDIITEKPADYKSVAFGTAFHTGAFLLNGFTAVDAEEAFMGTMASCGATLNKNEREEIKRYLTLLAKDKTMQKLHEGIVFKERKIGSGGSLKSVDFYSHMGDKIVIIDYKTGEITPEIFNEYKNQLDGYAKILNKIYNKKTEQMLYHFHNGELKIYVIN